VGRFGMVSGVARSEQIKPQMSRLLRAVLGYLASAVALASMGGCGDARGRVETRRWVRELWDSDQFIDMVEARRAKFATM